MQLSAPTMKWLMFASWILLVLEVGFVVMLAVTKNMGDDAAGRGMATGFAMLLAPIVLVAGGLLLWGSFGGPKWAFWVGFLCVASPLIFGAVNFAGGMLKEVGYARGRATYGSFADARLTKIARAIDQDDTGRVRELLSQGAPDWKARDERGMTLLGHAIWKAIDDYGEPRIACVRLLIDAGAPVTNDAMAPARTQASISEDNLVYHLFAVHNPSANAILDLVLSKGLGPDQLDEDGRPIYYSTYATVPSLEILAKHGADFTRLDPRTDRLHQNALMNALDLQQWPNALFFLRRGIPMDYKAPDGRSARSILAEVAPPPGSTLYGPDQEAYEAILTLIGTPTPPR